MPSFEAYKDGYLANWKTMHVTKMREAEQQDAAILRAKDRLRVVERRTGVPWYVVGIISLRESGLVAGNLDFHACLHNGEHTVGTNRSTQLVPRGVHLGPKASWEDWAVDALVREGAHRLNWHGEDNIVELVAWLLEKFNGFGYRRYGIPSPYLFGGTSVQRAGKFVRDGVFSRTAMDPQIGGMALLWVLLNVDHVALTEDHPAESVAHDDPAHRPVVGGKAVEPGMEYHDKPEQPPMPPLAPLPPAEKPVEASQPVDAPKVAPVPESVPATVSVPPEGLWDRIKKAVFK